MYVMVRKQRLQVAERWNGEPTTKQTDYYVLACEGKLASSLELHKTRRPREYLAGMSTGGCYCTNANHVACKSMCKAILHLQQMEGMQPLLHYSDY